MTDPARTVFISYRREVSRWLARAVFQDLRAHDYDVFMDVESIDSGEFERVILTQIDARAHFVVVLEPGSLDRIADPGDWLCREIARAIGSDRNVVPITAGGLRLRRDTRLPGGIARLRGFNALDVPEDYFDDAMQKLRERFLKRPAPALTPAPAETEAAVSRKIEHTRELIVGGDLTASLFTPRLSGEAFPGGVALRWSKGFLTSEYALERGLDDAFTSAVEVYRGPEREYRDRFLIPAVWHYRVRAVRAAGAGAWSDPIVISPGAVELTGEEPAPPLATLGPKFAALRITPVLSATHVGSATVLSWTPVPMAAEYVVESTGLFDEAWKEVHRGSELRYRPGGLFGGMSRYRVRALGFRGRPIGEWSEPVSGMPG